MVQLSSAGAEAVKRIHLGPGLSLDEEGFVADPAVMLCHLGKAVTPENLAAATRAVRAALAGSYPGVPYRIAKL